MTIPDILDDLARRRDQAVAEQCFYEAVLWRDLQEQLVEINDMEPAQARARLSVVAASLVTVSTMMNLALAEAENKAA